MTAPSAALAIGILVFTATAANAKGCWEGAIVGAVVGHYAGHHAILGAVGGCAFGKMTSKQYQEYKTAHPDEHITFTKYLKENKEDVTKQMQQYKESIGSGSATTAPAPK